MQPGQVVFVRTDPATQFVDAIAQNAMGQLTIPMVPPGTAPPNKPLLPGFVDGGLAAGGTCRGKLESIVIASVQPIDWEVWLWGNDDFSTADPRNEYLFGYASLPASGAKQISAAGLYYYSLGSLTIPYVDLKKLGNVYLGLIPRTAGGKAAGAGGSVVVQLGFLPTLGW